MGPSLWGFSCSSTVWCLLHFICHVFVIVVHLADRYVFITRWMAVQHRACKDTRKDTVGLTSSGVAKGVSGDCSGLRDKLMARDVLQRGHWVGGWIRTRLSCGDGPYQRSRRVLWERGGGGVSPAAATQRATGQEVSTTRCPQRCRIFCQLQSMKESLRVFSLLSYANRFGSQKPMRAPQI